MIHPTADVSAQARIGEGTRIWNNAQIREGARVGSNCIVGKDVYIDSNVVIGDNVKVENGALIYHGVIIEDGVFVGPLVCFTNDRIPRAITTGGRLKTNDDWVVGEMRVRFGASIGAGAIILSDITIGEWAFVGAGAVVTHDVPSYALVVGNPARRVGYVCKCGHRLEERSGAWVCQTDGAIYRPMGDGGLVRTIGEDDSDI